MSSVVDTNREIPATEDALVRAHGLSALAMVVNLIVGFVTLLMAGFIAVWVFFPYLWRWIEEPKYRFLEQQRRFPEVLREPTPPPRRE